MVYQDPVAGSRGDGSTTDVAKEQAGRVGQKAAEAGGQVAQTTKEQAQNVVGEAKQQARDLVGEARTQVRDQAGTQRDRAVQGLRAVSDELEQMTWQGGQSGIATEVARQLSSRTRDLASHLERHEPSELLEQVRSYARRRPVFFLAGAALAGVVAGRLTKSLAAGAPDSGTRALGGGYDNGYGAQPLAVEPAPYATSDYPGAGYQTGTGYAGGAGYQTATGYEGGAGYQTGAGYQAGAEYPAGAGYQAQPGYEGDGYRTPAYGTPGTPGADEYGTTGGGFREPAAGQPAAYPPAEPYEPVTEAEQPPGRGWTP